jgi:hypothetical protein
MRTAFALGALLVIAFASVRILTDWPVKEDHMIRVAYQPPLAADLAEWLTSRYEVVLIPIADRHARHGAVVEGTADVALDLTTDWGSISWDPESDSSTIAGDRLESLLHGWNTQHAVTALKARGIDRALLEPVRFLGQADIYHAPRSFHLFAVVLAPVLLLAALVLGVTVRGGRLRSRLLRGTLFALALSAELWLVLPFVSFRGPFGFSVAFSNWWYLAPWVLVYPVGLALVSGVSIAAASEPGALQRVRLAFAVVAAVALMLALANVLDSFFDARGYWPWLFARAPQSVTLPALALCAAASLVLLLRSRAAAKAASL